MTSSCVSVLCVQDNAVLLTAFCQQRTRRNSGTRRGRGSAARGRRCRTRLFGGGADRSLRRGEHGGGFLGDARALEEARVLRAPQPDRIGKGEIAEIVGGDVAVLDQ